MAPPIDRATFSGAITLRRRPSEAPPDADPAVELEEPEPLRETIRLGELDQVLEAALVEHWPELDVNVVTTHTDR